MNRIALNVQRILLPWCALAFGSLPMATLVAGHADAQHSAPDNVSINKARTSPTADQQYMNLADRKITQQIRKVIHHDRSLSPQGRNIKIFIQNGKVTLRGPVQSLQEKGNLAAKAASVAGPENVTNQLEVAPSK
jgi:hyperosmotically inducible periplasmic protein